MGKYILLLFNIALSVSGQFFLKFGLGKITNASGIDLIFKAIQNPYIILGVACYGVGMLTWFLVLSKFSLSVAYPALSLGYIVILLISWKFLGEPITSLKIIGIALIVSGVICIFKA